MMITGRTRVAFTADLGGELRVAPGSRRLRVAVARPLRRRAIGERRLLGGRRHASVSRLGAQKKHDSDGREIGYVRGYEAHCWQFVRRALTCDRSVLLLAINRDRCPTAVFRLPFIMLVVMITGASGCGKSSVAAAVAAQCDDAQGRAAGPLFLGRIHAVRRGGRRRVRAPEHVDWPRLREAVELRGGRPARDRARRGPRRLCDDAPSRGGAVVFLGAEREACCARRVGRKRPAAEAASLRAYYERFAWPAHERDVRPRLDALRARADNARPALHVCAAEQPLERVVADVLECIGPLQSDRCRS